MKEEDRKISEQKAEEERIRAEAELTTDEETGERKKREKKRSTKRKKKGDDGSSAAVPFPPPFMMVGLRSISSSRRALLPCRFPIFR